MDWYVSFLGFVIGKVINVDVASRFPGRIVEDGIAGAHEEPGVAEPHLERPPDAVPLFAVGAVLEGGEFSPVIVFHLREADAHGCLALWAFHAL